MSSKPTIAWFGATGGCTFAAFNLAVKDGYTCYALVRDPAKLTKMLSDNGVSVTSLSNLTIIQGTLQDQSAIRDTLAPNGEPADIIISGVGGLLMFRNCPPGFTLDNPSICEEATGNMFAALRSLGPNSKRPYFCTLSTTGINGPHKRDVPIAMLPMYHLMLPVPHADKQRMEALVVEEFRGGAEKSVISGYLLVRPSLLTNGGYTSVHKIRVGTDVAPAVGYTISRNDVGLWMYETVIKSGKLSPGANVASITY